MAEGSRELQMWLGANVTFNGRGEPRWARGNHVQDANDATVRGIIINIGRNRKDVATTAGTVGNVMSVTQTTLSCSRALSSTEYLHAVEGRPARGDAHVAAPMKPPTDE